MDYWREYLGRAGGAAGYAVQLLCVRLPQRAFCFSNCMRPACARRGCGASRPSSRASTPARWRRPWCGEAEPLVVFAGRMIPEKRAAAGVAGVLAAARRIPELRATFYGDGPERPAVLAAIASAGAQGFIDAPGFVAAEEIDAALRRALCMLLPSRREGYGMVVVEAAARATPSIVVAADDNAATELIEEGMNGFAAPGGRRLDCRGDRARSRPAWRCGGAPPSGSRATRGYQSTPRWRRSLRDTAIVTSDAPSRRPRLYGEGHMRQRTSPAARARPGGGLVAFSPLRGGPALPGHARRRDHHIGSPLSVPATLNTAKTSAMKGSIPRSRPVPKLPTASTTPTTPGPTPPCGTWPSPTVSRRRPKKGRR